MDKYSYSGPVYAFGNKIGDVQNITTKCTTYDKAYSNILYSIEKKLNMSPGAKLEFNKDDIQLVSSNDALKDLPKYCSTCKARLTDAGDCRVCDFRENPDDIL